MARHSWIASASFVLILLGLPAPAQKPMGLPSSVATKVEATIAEEVSRNRLPGLSVAVVADRQLQWSKGFGKSDLENDVLATADTVYRLASISKTITAIAAMQLAERGKLDLDAPVQKYVPSFPEKPWTITARHVLGHLSGIRHYTRDGQAQQNELNNTKHFAKLADGLALFKDDALLHQPGSRYTYTTHGYTLLGCVVEGASGTNFLEYVRENITKPAGMNTFRDDDLATIIPHRAQGYRRVAGELRNSLLLDSSYKIPGGGFCSTVEDLARFAIAVQSDKLVQAKTREQMFTRQKLNDGQLSTYGLGWQLGDRDGRQVVSHSGAQQRVSTLLYMLPSDGFAVVLMCNLEGTNLSRLAGQIADTVAPAN